MKRCPNCQSVYTDDSLSYCLQDGSQLRVVSDSASSTHATLQMGGRELPPTEILKPEDMPTARIEATALTKEQRARSTTLVRDEETAIAAAEPRSNATVIALSVVVTLLLVTLGGLITWVMMRDKGQAASSTNASNPITNTNANTTTKPSAVDLTAEQREVQDMLNAWADSIRQRNLDEHMKYYADVLDVYYNSTNVSRERVRADRSAAFSKYTSLDMQLSNVKISVDSSGARATATFDKTFKFQGEKEFSGSGLNRFWFTKAGGRWRITGEKDLQTYYINK